jgi:hypothetical protein
MTTLARTPIDGDMTSASVAWDAIAALLERCRDGQGRTRDPFRDVGRDTTAISARSGWPEDDGDPLAIIDVMGRAGVQVILWVRFSLACTGPARRSVDLTSSRKSD